jgi:hypothetical protein
LEHQLLVLRAADLVDGLVHRLHHVEAVEDDLLLRVEQALLGGGDEGLRHVHRHRLDPHELMGFELLKEAPQGLLRAPLADVYDPLTAQIVDQREDAELAADRLLVDADRLDIQLTARREAPLDRALHDLARLVPGDPEQPCAAAHAGLLQHPHRQRLKQEREAGARLRPRHLHLSYAVIWTPHTRHPRPDECLKLAAIEVPPAPLVRVIMEPAQLTTLRARPPQPLLVAQ